MDKLARVFGRASFIISVDVENADETLGLMEANYRFDPNLIVDYELIATDCKGKTHKIAVHNCDKMELEEFVE
jgi:hypothetical protein